MMKKLISAIFLFTCLSIQAQIMSPELYHNNVEAGLGIQGVPNSNNGVNLRLDLSYGYFFRNGIGFRTGATYTPDMYKVGEAVGTSVSFAWRSFRLDKSYSSDTIDYDDYNPDYMLHQDYTDYAKEQIATGLARILTHMANSIEIDAGVTPGCIFGRKADSFYMTGDIGLKTTWRIWRFNLTINPAVHYMLTNKINLGPYKMELSPRERWQLSLMFGVSFML